MNRIGTLLKDVAPVGPTGSGGPISSDVSSRQDRGDERTALHTGGAEGSQRSVGLTWKMIQGTGIGGRVTLKDVRSFVEQD